MLSSSEKSAACRSLVNGRDLIWRQVDLHGVPKHVEDWPFDALLVAMESVELRNAVRREADCQVLWLDLEFAALRVDDEQGFDAKARQEVLALEGFLQEVETIAPRIVETGLAAKASSTTRHCAGRPFPSEPHRAVLSVMLVVGRRHRRVPTWCRYNHQFLFHRVTDSLRRNLLKLQSNEINANYATLGLSVKDGVPMAGTLGIRPQAVRTKSRHH
jgi:hypothetical protein